MRKSIQSLLQRALHSNAKISSDVFFRTINEHKSNKDASNDNVWHKNWDYREPADEHTSENPRESNAIRNIVLVRHGEYSVSSKELTDHGRLQSKHTGRRLRELNLKWEQIISSTMPRALQSSEIIIKELNVDMAQLTHCALVNAAFPILPDPPTRPIIPDVIVPNDGPRIEEAFRQYFYRAAPAQVSDSHLLIITHSTVIRYLFCRALQLPPVAWSRISLYNGSITWIIIGPTGHVRARYLGEFGFMPFKDVTNFKAP